MFRRVRDADVYNSVDASFFGSFDEPFRILDGIIKCDLSVREADPVGVVEGCCSLQTFHQLARIIEVEWGSAHLVAEWVFTVWAPSESSDPFPHRKQPLCYVVAGVAESSCYHVQFGSFHG